MHAGTSPLEYKESHLYNLLFILKILESVISPIIIVRNNCYSKRERDPMESKRPALMSSLFPSVPTPKNQHNVGIVTKTANGLGDLIFAVRLYHLLLQTGYKPCFILLDIEEDGKKLQEIFNINKDALFDAWKKLPEFQCYAIGPGVTHVPTALEMQMKNKDVILFSEYDYFKHLDMLKRQLASCQYLIAIKTGVSPESKGVIFEPALLMPRDIPADYDKFNTLEHSTLKKILLKGHTPSSYPEKRTLFLAICSFHPSAHIPILHAAYHACAERANKKKTDCDLVLINSDKNNIIYWNPVGYLNSIIPVLKGFYNKFSIYNVDEDKQVAEIQQRGDLQREFRIVVGKRIPNDDVLKLHLITGHNFTTVSGDGSLAEVLSKIAPFFYIVEGAQYKPEHIKYLADLFPALNQVNDLMKEEKYVRAAELIYQNRILFQDVCEKLRSDKNLRPVITKLFEELSNKWNIQLSSSPAPEHPGDAPAIAKEIKGASKTG